MPRRCAVFVALWMSILGCSRGAQPSATTQGANTIQQTSPSEPAAASPASSAAQQLIMQARQAGTRKQGDAPNFEGSISQLEQALELEPTNNMALGMIVELANNQAKLSSQRGDTDKADELQLKCASYLRRLQQGSEPLSEQQKELAPTVYYNEARVLARQQHAAESVAALKNAFDAGFNDVAKIDSNSDFDQIRMSSEFAAWRKQVGER